MKNRSRIAVLIVMIFMLGAFTITAYQTSSKTIVLVDGGKVTQYQTEVNNVEELLEQLEINLGDKDTIEPELNEQLEDNLKITIDRWVPTVTFIENKESITIKTGLETVGELLKAKGLESGDDYSVEPSEETKIEDGMTITVATKETKTVVEERPIGFATVEKLTNDLPHDETKVIEEGKNGVKLVTLENVYEGGELVEQVVKNVEIKEEAQDEVILRGKSVNIITANEMDYEYTKVYDMEATAYSDTEGDGWGSQTASGMTAGVGIIAVDPRVIPLGTKLYVEGYGLCIAGDTGGAIKGERIDLFYKTRKECRDFGRRPKKVYVLKDQDLDVLAAR